MSDKIASADQAANPERMQCMEIRGGNRRVNDFLELPGLKAWIFGRPHEESESGGDVHYISSCASGRITRLLLADVSGHGSRVSGVAVGLRELMRQNINHIKQTRLVRAMNRQFAEAAEQGSFATAVVCTYFAPSRSLQVCNAGHPRALLYRCRQGDWSVVEQTGEQESGIADIPLGLFNQAAYSQLELKLDPGDLLLCYSDAITDAHDRDGGSLSIEEVLKILQSLDPARPEQLIPDWLDGIAGRHPENLLEDDVTVLLAQVTETRPTLKNNLTALLRLMGSVRDSTRLE